jgi:ATP-dependent DNA ligase
MPEFIKPQLATLKTKAPSGAQWLHEIKYDGYRVQVHLNGGRKRVFTRNGLDWTKRFTAPCRRTQMVVQPSRLAGGISVTPLATWAM